MFLAQKAWIRYSASLKCFIKAPKTLSGVSAFLEVNIHLLFPTVNFTTVSKQRAWPLLRGGWVPETEPRGKVRRAWVLMLLEQTCGPIRTGRHELMQRWKWTTSKVLERMILITPALHLSPVPGTKATWLPIQQAGQAVTTCTLRKGAACPPPTFTPVPIQTARSPESPGDGGSQSRFRHPGS